jgi:hypothetical protein
MFFHHNSIYWFILLVSDKYESEEPEEMKVNNDCELILAKLKIKGSKDLYIASCYRPPDNRDSIYIDNLQTYLAKILAFDVWTSLVIIIVIKFFLQLVIVFFSILPYFPCYS